MEDDKSKYPSLPSNYVSLLQLQERRLKQKERNKRGDEEGELKNKEEQEGLGNTDNVILKENPKGKVVANTDSCFSCPTWNRNRRYHSEKCAQRTEWSKHKEESSIEAFWGCNEDGKTNGLKKEEKTIWRNKGKARAEGKAQLMPKNGTGENASVIVTFVKEKSNMKRQEKGGELKLKGVVVEEKITEKNPTRDSATMPSGKESKDIPMVEIGGERRRDKKSMSEYRRHGDHHQMKTDVREQKVTKDPAFEIERNFQNLALDGERWSNMRFRSGVNGGKWRYQGRSGGFGPPRMQKQRDDSFVWVKKGEVSNTK